MVNVPLLRPLCVAPGWTWPSCRNSTVHEYADAGSAPSIASLPSPLKVMTSPATNVAPSVGARIVAAGGVPTLMVSGVETVVFTPSDTDNRTVYGPATG